MSRGGRRGEACVDRTPSAGRVRGPAASRLLRLCLLGGAAERPRRQRAGHPPATRTRRVGGYIVLPKWPLRGGMRGGQGHRHGRPGGMRPGAARTHPEAAHPAPASAARRPTGGEAAGETQQGSGCLNGCTVVLFLLGVLLIGPATRFAVVCLVIATVIVGVRWMARQEERRRTPSAPPGTIATSAFARPTWKRMRARCSCAQRAPWTPFSPRPLTGTGPSTAHATRSSCPTASGRSPRTCAAWVS